MAGKRWKGMYFSTDDSLADHLKYRVVTGLGTLVDGLVSTLTLGFVSTGLGYRAAFRYARRPKDQSWSVPLLHKDQFVPSLDLWLDDPPSQHSLHHQHVLYRDHPKIGDA